jgi:hypothetical protein
MLCAYLVPTCSCVAIFCSSTSTVPHSTCTSRTKLRPPSAVSVTFSELRGCARTNNVPRGRAGRKGPCQRQQTECHAELLRAGVVRLWTYTPTGVITSTRVWPAEHAQLAGKLSCHELHSVTAPAALLMSTTHEKVREVGHCTQGQQSAHGLTRAASSAPAAPAAVRKSLSCNALVSSAMRLRLCLARTCRQCAGTCDLHEAWFRV